MKLNYRECDLCGQRWEHKDGDPLVASRTVHLDFNDSTPDDPFNWGDLCPDCRVPLRNVVREKVDELRGSKKGVVS